MSKARTREMAEVWVCEAARRALDQYSADHVDAVYNEETGMVDIIYHSSNNSFAIESGVADMRHIDKRHLAKELGIMGVGYCW